MKPISSTEQGGCLKYPMDDCIDSDLHFVRPAFSNKLRRAKYIVGVNSQIAAEVVRHKAKRFGAHVLKMVSNKDKEQYFANTVNSLCKQRENQVQFTGYACEALTSIAKFINYFLRRTNGRYI